MDREIVGVLVIIAGLLIAAGRFAFEVVRRRQDAYQAVRRRLGRALLLGLELLVAGDVISTVAVDLTFASLGQLAILVAVRTFLSWALEVEIDGRWPWQRAGGSS